MRITKYLIKAEKVNSFNLPFQDEPISPEKAYYLIKEIWKRENLSILKEFSLALSFNQANRVVGYTLLSIGTDNTCFIDVKEVTKFALDTYARSIIVAHLHPSGNLSPSSSDLEITDRVKKGLDVFNIKLLDSIIFTEENFNSLLG